MNIIEKIIPTEATRKIVQAIAPVLIYWAKTGQTHHTYGDLSVAINRPKYHRFGHALAMLQDVIDELSASSNRNIPTLNSLLRNKTKGIPSDGFNYVNKKYDKLDLAGKKIFIEGLNSRAIKYPYWDWVLAKLGLSPYAPLSDNEVSLIKTANIKHGTGEGKEHKELKEEICAHPELIGIKGVIKAAVEYALPSGDKLDVYFELEDGTNIAVEVKPSTSDDSDIIRGIFQCVKYKAVLDAIQTVDSEGYEVKVIYVTARELSNLHSRLISVLSVNHQYLLR